MRKPHVSLFSLAVGLGSFGGVSAWVGGLVALMAGAAQAATITPALPGNSTNLFAGDFANGNGGAWNGSSPGPAVYNSENPSNITDNDLDTAALSTYEGAGTANGGSAPTIDIKAAVFAVDSTAHIGPLGLTGNINFIRLWAQPLYNGDIYNSYRTPPDQLSIRYDYTGTNVENGNTVNVGSFSSSATILSVNGATPTYIDPGPDTTVSFAASDWQGPVADNTPGPGSTPNGQSPGAYYIDLGVIIPSTNGVLFDFGTQPDRSAQNAGIFANEIQAANVPEPTSLCLLGLGAAGLLVRRRRA